MDVALATRKLAGAFGRKAKPGDARRHERRDAGIAATIRTLTGASEEIVLEEISCGGFSAAVAMATGEGQLMRLALPGGRAPHVRVVHAAPGRTGFAFLEPLPTEDLQRIVAG